jgi:hypothetical protein
MMSMMRLSKLLFVLCAVLTWGSANAATYQVVFNTTWNESNFPTNFPSDRHFSDLFGATHNGQVRFWEVGQFASVGIENMAELGSNSELLNEIQSAINEGKAEFTLSGDYIPPSTDEVSLRFDISENYPLVTLVSMLAPSPDWFVGIHDLNLYEGGTWIAELTVNLSVYDAGTDDGTQYNSSDKEPISHGVITLLSSNAGDTDFLNGVHQINGAYVGTFTFTRIQ